MAVQKWSKGKMKEKVNNMVLFDKVRCFAPGTCNGGEELSTSILVEAKVVELR